MISYLDLRLFGDKFCSECCLDFFIPVIAADLFYLNIMTNFLHEYYTVFYDIF